MEQAVDAVPFQVPNANIPFVVMTAEAAGQPIKVLLDTGNATGFAVVMGESAGGRTGAAPTGEPVYVTHAVAGGDSASLTPARLQDFRLGPIHLRPASVGLSASVDRLGRVLPGGLDAVIGYQVVRTRIVAIDYERKTVDFSARRGPAGAAISFAITSGKPLTVVEARINGEGPFHLVLDTGASGTLLSPQAAARAGIGAAGARVPLGGAGGASQSGRIERAAIEVGASRWADTPVVVADIMGPAAAEAGAELDGVLGAPLLAHGTLILDYPGRRAWIAADPRK